MKSMFSYTYIFIYSTLIYCTSLHGPVLERLIVQRMQFENDDLMQTLYFSDEERKPMNGQ